MFTQCTIYRVILEPVYRRILNIRREILTLLYLLNLILMLFSVRNHQILRIFRKATKMAPQPAFDQGTFKQSYCLYDNNFNIFFQKHENMPLFKHLVYSYYKPSNDWSLGSARSKHPLPNVAQPPQPINAKLMSIVLKSNGEVNGGSK